MKSSELIAPATTTFKRHYKDGNRIYWTFDIRFLNNVPDPHFEDDFFTIWEVKMHREGIEKPIFTTSITTSCNEQPTTAAVCLSLQEAVNHIFFPLASIPMEKWNDKGSHQF
jgi:hypothetical protein